MSKTYNFTCQTCGGNLAAAAFGIVTKGDLTAIRYFCSLRCRAQAISSTTQTKTTMTEERAGRKPKKPPRTPAEIKKAMQPTEAQISKTVRDDMRLTAAFSSRLQSGAVRVGKHYLTLCTTGTPDSFFASGVICFVEFKIEGQDSSDDQKAAQAALRANGALCFVVKTPEDYAFIKSELKKRKIQVADIKQKIERLQADIEFNLDNFRDGIK